MKMDASQPATDAGAPAAGMPAAAVPTPAGGPMMGTRVPSLAEAGYEELRERRPAGRPRRYLTTNRHLIGLLLGGAIDYSRTRPEPLRRGLKFRAIQVAGLFMN